MKKKGNLNRKSLKDNSKDLKSKKKSGKPSEHKFRDFKDRFMIFLLFLALIGFVTVVYVVTLNPNSPSNNDSNITPPITTPNSTIPPIIPGPGNNQTVAPPIIPPRPSSSSGGSSGGGDDDPVCTPGSWANTNEYRCLNGLRERKQTKTLCPSGTDERWDSQNCSLGYVCYDGENAPVNNCILNTSFCIGGDESEYVTSSINLTNVIYDDSCLDSFNLTKYLCYYNGSEFIAINNTIECNDGCSDDKCSVPACSTNEDCSNVTGIVENSICNNPYLDFNPANNSICEISGFCSVPTQTISQTCDISCGASCEEDTDCACPVNTCIDADADGFFDDYVSYSNNPTCDNSCECEVGTGAGEACEAITTLNDLENCATQTCSNLGGDICTEEEYCFGSLIDSSDGNGRCCNEVCSSEEPIWDECGDCGNGWFNLCDVDECYSILEGTNGCYFEGSFECTTCADISCSNYDIESDCTNNRCDSGVCLWEDDSCVECVASTEICNDGIDNDCDLLVDNDDSDCDVCNTGDTRNCGSDVGECRFGSESCVDGQWSGSCNGGIGPNEENCDGLDNDCDGSVDDGLTMPTTCGVGECTGNTGVKTCSAGIWTGDTCNSLEGATSEVCDNLDNDCDGTIDEDLIKGVTCGTGECNGNTGTQTCSAGVWGSNTCSPFAGAVAEVCDNKDNDCDGTIDEGLTQSTTCGVGECSGNTGTETCNAGSWIGDTCNPLEGAIAEVCEGLLDENCNGDIDDGCACTNGETRACGSDVGICSSGTETCTGGFWTGVCVGEVTPTSEVCDNLDNDCDGQIDESLTQTTTCGVGVCSGNTGIQTCFLGTWGGDTCNPFQGGVAESCDNLDNDCDGTVDEDLMQTTNCGAGECSGNTGTQTCSLGVWIGDTCSPFAGAVVEVCDNLDNDCDGIVDEGLTRGTTCGTGECNGNTGIETCFFGTWGANTCDPFAGAVAEVCDGLLDDNCDGTIDESCGCINGDTYTCGSNVGECSTGIETCVGGTRNGLCEGEIGPTIEICDGLDNDCDGTIDEDLTQSTTCGVGECVGNTGTQTCNLGTWVGDTCNPLQGATSETCNNLDDNCDGTIDEDLTQSTTCGIGECVGNTGTETCNLGVWGGDTCDPFAGATTESCDGFLDQNCNGIVDEGCGCTDGETRACGSDVGECMAGIQTCNEGSWSGVCVGEITPTSEVCDNLDNDCNGVVDEGLTQSTTCGTGECSGNIGSEFCFFGIWVGDTCDAFAGATSEVCDNLDNDCDWQIDEGLTQPTTCGTGTCFGNVGTETCFFGTWGSDTCDPFAGATSETCDGLLDENCDGTTDEGCACTNGETRNCGSDVGACSFGSETCVGGAWSGVCVGEVTPVSEICDNLDNDCDGSIDEGLTQSTTCGVGECNGNTGSETCNAGSWIGNTCDPFAGAISETCDNKDNDCDGTVDEDLTQSTTCGLGNCFGNIGQETCSAGVWGSDTCDALDGAVAEVCEGILDENCNGIVDDGCGCTNGETRACGSDVGACSSGTETCSGGIWGGVCVGEVTPVSETCDNLDNDCDGSIDEGLTRGTSCGIGECSSNTGTETCSAGVWGSDTCDPFAGATSETCNNLDDNCDGQIDESLTQSTTCGVGECNGNTGQETCFLGIWGGDTCNPFAGAVPEVCDGSLDENCNGIVDDGCGCTNGETRVCGSDVGECVSGTESCSGGIWDGNCVGEVIPVIEVCDGLDNNCDGTVDEGCSCINGDTRACGSDVGVCVAGVESCSGGIWDGNCVGEVTSSLEVCDNLDNNCDGSIDEDLTQSTTCGVGECAGNTGTETCTLGVWGGDTCNPWAGGVAETCNNLDDDCDGFIDEGLIQSTNCGVGECSGNTGIEICTAGVWALDTCDPFEGAKFEVCDNLDNDCDGFIDENLIQATTCGVGECTGNTGSEICVLGIWGSDTCDPFAGATIETCDNRDNDCDGTIDEDLTQSTTCGVGECSGNSGEETCSFGSWIGDTCNPLDGAVAEVCEGLLDEDCDGTIDEGCSSTCINGQIRSCGSDVGECVAGIEACSGGIWSGVCVGEVAPITEICEGLLDEDCDGVIDNGCGCTNGETRVCGSDVGECKTGTETCTGGFWTGVCVGEVTPEPEVCDTDDNDCDGVIDNGVLNTYYRDEDNDYHGNINITIESCSAPAGYTGDSSDCDDSNPNVNHDEVEVCNGIDDNCDGTIDEGCGTNRFMAHYGFEDGFEDGITEDALGNNDAIVDGATRVNDPERGYVASFDGINDYIDLNNMDVGVPFDASKGEEMTISLWFKADNVSGCGPRLISKATTTASEGHYFMLSFCDDRLRSRLKTTEVNTFTLKSTNPLDNLKTSIWTHVAMTYNGAKMKIYKDGIEVNGYDIDNSITGVIATNYLVPTWLGASPDSTNYYKGLMDDVKIYNRTLSNQEIMELAEIGVCNEEANQAPDNLVAYYKFEDYGSSLVDISGNENHGNLILGDNPTTGVFGIMDNAMNFDGSEFIRIPYDDSLNTSKYLSLSIWLKPVSIKSQEFAFGTWDGYSLDISRGGPASSQVPHFWINHYTSGGGSDKKVTSNIPLNIGEWSHIVGTYNIENNFLKIYINGQLTGSVNVSNTDYPLPPGVPIGGTRFYVGRASSDSSMFTGSIDELSIWNKTLNLEEVQELYNEGSASNACEFGSSLPSASPTSNFWTRITDFFTNLLG